MQSIKQLFTNTGRVNRIVWRDNRFMIVALFVSYTLLSIITFLQSGSVALLINQLLISVSQGSITTLLTYATAGLVFATTLPSFILTYALYMERLLYLRLEEIFIVLIARRKGELDVAHHEDPKQQDLFSKVNEQGVWKIQSFTDRQLFIYQNILEVVIASGIILVSEPLIFVILLVFTLPELVIETRYGNDVWGIWQANAEVRRRFWNLHDHFQRVPNLIELKVSQSMQYFVRLLHDLFLSFQDEQRKKERAKLLSQLTGHLLAQIAVGAAIIWFVLRVLNGSMQVGTLTFMLAAIASLRTALSSLFTNLGKQYQDSLFVTDVFALIDLPTLVQEPTTPIILGTSTPEITFENVHFSYPGTDRPVLRGISFTINPGEKVGLIGINGAGKTTLVKLLCRFYDPTEGRILIDGHDLRQIPLDVWYKKLGLIFQEYSHYNFPVKEAIAIGDSRRKPSETDVVRAAKQAGADTFIRDWPKQYEQVLGNQFTDGIEPSIGQWQKLALARLFYRNSSILILDEPTSAIDAEAEAKIFEQLEKLPGNRTVILISHRFSTVRDADKIIVLKNGKLSELGTHKELMAQQKDYARIFAVQAKGYREE